MEFGRFAGEPITELLREVRTLGVSDLHCQVGSPPFVRIHGSQVYLKHPPYEAKALEAKVRDLLDDYHRKMLEETWNHDFCLDIDHGRYRTSVFRQRLGTDAVFRIIPDEVPTLASLHLPEYLSRFTKYSQGIVLITGPAGCGKSATMAALVDIVNQDRRDHIVTVEDPIEYVFESKGCNVNQRQVKVHTENFATALRSALRADPDVIVIGEMRDLETVSIAITAAETGHLVLATLHTTTAIRSVDRIIDVFPPKEQEQIRAMVAESMRGVISQQLIPRKDGRGREPALEIMFATPAVANLIRDSKTFQLTSVLQTGARLGMKIMDDSLQELLDKGLITKETAQYHASIPERFGRKKGETLGVGT
jgi:twitching motility protein PilT